MKNNWLQFYRICSAVSVEEDFDDYGSGEDHRISIGDELEASDKSGVVHAGVVVGIIRDINGCPVCYKVWDEEHDDFDYIQASDSIVCEPCGSSQWALERIGYKKKYEAGEHGFYFNDRIKDVIFW